MPSRKIEVTEYQCAKCNYRWTNYRNGKEGPKPKRCSRCKKWDWDWDEGKLSPIEKQLRRDLLKIEDNKIRYSTWIGDTGICSIPTDICATFLSIYPRPTEEELRIVLNPICYLGPHSHKYNPLSHKGTCSDQVNCMPGWISIPVPDKPGYYRYDYDEKIFKEMVRIEKDVRHQLMQHIIDSRGGSLNTNSTHYRYFEDKKRMAKRLSKPRSVFECDDEESISSKVSHDELSD